MTTTKIPKSPIYDQTTGYPNIGWMLDQHQLVTLIVGGRSTGKTVSTIKEFVERRKKFIFMRRTQSELIAIAGSPELSPLPPVNRLCGTNMIFKRSSKYTFDILNCPDPDSLDGAVHVGLAFALTDVAHIRGFDATPYDYMLYDEFIPEPHVRTLRDEAGAFLSAIDTIVRNREVEGTGDFQVICAANSNRLANPLFIGLDIVAKADEMASRGQFYSILSNRSILLVSLMQSSIASARKQTQIGRAHV